MQAHPQSSSAALAPSSFRSPDPLGAGSAVPSTALENARAVAESAALAHDARNLLGGIRLYCDLLDRPGILGPRHRHYAAELRRLSERGAHLLERLLGHIDAPSPPPPSAALHLHSTPPPADPAAALHEFVPLLRRMAAPGAAIELQAPPRLPAGAFPAPALTAETLERIVVNLVCNAAKALLGAQRSGQIRITLRPAADHLRLTVSDDGPGLSPGLAAAFLAPTPPPAFARQGLGHRIVHDLAQATGALFSVDSGPARGTTFTLQWNAPGSNAPGSMDASATRPPASAPALHPSTDRPPLPRSGSRSPKARKASHKEAVRTC